MNNNVFISLENSLSLAINQMIINVFNYIPALIGALIIFFAGVYLSKLAKDAVIKVFSLTKISSKITNPAIKKFLKNAQFSQKIEEIVGEIVRWLVIAIFFSTGVSLLGLTSVNNFLNAIFGYLPNLVAAILILFIGIILAGFFEKLVKGSIGGIDTSASRLLGKFTSYTVMIIALLAAISQLGIAQKFIELIFTGLIATISLALGLGFGLGSKDLIKKLLEDWYKNHR